MKRLGEAVWQTTYNRCDIWAAVHYKVIYAETGFSENLQKYIVAIEKSSHELQWQFTRKTISPDSPVKQNFEVPVSFQFVKLQESDLEGSSEARTDSWYNFNGDLFYAFSSKSGATASIVSSVTVLATLLLLAAF